MMLKQILTGGSICALLLLMGLPAQAQTQEPAPPAAQPQTEPQTGVSAQEVEQFANAIRQMRDIQNDAHDQATQILEQTELTVQRFNEMLHVQQDPAAAPETPITPEEQQHFDQAFAQITQIQQDVELRMERAIEQEGLNMERFNQIFAMVQQNPELRQQVEQILQRGNETSLS